MVRVHASVVFSHKLTLVTFVHVEGDSQAAFELCHLHRCSQALLWNSDRRADVCNATRPFKVCGVCLASKALVLEAHVIHFRFENRYPVTSTM